MRQTLIKVWQRGLTPKQARREFVRAGPKLNFNKEQEEMILEIFSALRRKEINVIQAEQELKEEGLYEYNETEGRVEEDLCQI